MNPIRFDQMVRGVIGIAILLISLNLLPAYAQTFEEGDEDLLIHISEIKFDGNTVIDTETLQEVVADFKDVEMTLEELNEIVNLVTISYQEKGFILARAFLPKQDIKDGILTIGVMEGEIGKIEVAGYTHYKPSVVKRYFMPQIKKKVIKESILEKGLLLSNDLPNLKTDVVLKKSEEPGKVDMVVNTKDTAALTFGMDVEFDYNNFGSEVVSADRFGTRIDIVDHNWGSLLSVRGVQGTYVKDSTLGKVDFSIPVWHYGTHLNFQYIAGNYVVGQALADLGLQGNTIIYGMSISHPLIKKKNKNLTITLGISNKYSRNKILGQSRSVDDVNVAYASLDFDSLDRYLGKNILSFTTTFGDVRPDRDIATSRLKAAKHFERVNVSYARVQKLYGYTNFFLRASAQIANDRLLPIEQTVLGGYGTVRGYDPSIYIGDSSWNLSGELMFAPPGIGDRILFGQRIAQLAQFSLFYDHGNIFISESEPGENHERTLSGAGVGFRIFYKNRFQFKYDVAFPIKKIPDKDRVFHYFLATYKLF